MPKRVVVFDLDGTLIDSHLDIANALNDVLGMLGLPSRDPAVVKRMIGHGLTKLLERALDDPSKASSIKAHFKEAYLARLTQTTRLYEGIESMLSALSAHSIPTMIATNKPSFFANKIIDALGILKMGPCAVACADEVEHRKPNPQVVQLALDRANVFVEPSRVYYVGDMPVDVQTARNFGCYSVGVLWGFNPDALRTAQPDAVSDCPGKLEAVLLGGE